MARNAQPPVPSSALIVDDSPTIQRLLARVLTRMGVPADAIEATTDGLTGFRRFRKLEPDVVFLDLVLEGVQGTDVGELMLDHDPDACILLVTALDADDERVRSMVSQGARAVLEKPLDPSHVKDVLADVLVDRSDYGRISLEESPA